METETRKWFLVRWRYLLGVGVGLIIAWVTNLIEYIRVGAGTFPLVIEIEFEAVLSVIFIVLAIILRQVTKV